jgi:O-antigen ligase
MVALWLGTLVLLTSGVADMAGIRLRGQEYRISGFIRNPNTYVAMLVACVPSGYWFVVRTRIPLRRTVAAVAFVIAAATAIYTQSRGGIISVAILLLSLLAFRQTRWRGVVFAVLFLVLGFRLAPLAFWQRWEQTRAMGGDVRTKYLWPAGLSIFTRNPLLGSGLGTNGQALWGMAGARTSVVHNPPLAIAVELGLPGLSLYLGFMAYALVRLLRALAARMRQGSSKETAFAVVLLASFLGYMASWFKGGGAEAQKMLWVLLGLMSAYARMLEQPPSVAGARSLHPGRDGVRSRQ